LFLAAADKKGRVSGLLNELKGLKNLQLA
jgi:hypothetical protein